MTKKKGSTKKTWDRRLANLFNLRLGKLSERSGNEDKRGKTEKERSIGPQIVKKGKRFPLFTRLRGNPKLFPRDDGGEERKPPTRGSIPGVPKFLSISERKTLQNFKEAGILGKEREKGVG